MRIIDLFPSVDTRLLRERSFLNYPWLLLVEAAYDPKVLSLKKNFPEQTSDIDGQVKWAKGIFKARDGKELNDKITWWLNLYGEYLKFSQNPPVANQFKQRLGTYGYTTIDQLRTDVSHYFGYDSDAIRAFNFGDKPFSQIKAELDLKVQEFTKTQETDKPVPMMNGDYVLYDFPDGTKWIFCNRAFCSEEGRSGKHCGNVVGRHKPDQRILSLRDKVGRVILTFIFEPDGTLGEMKAKGNNKPAVKYHQHIYSLLMGSKLKITGISGMGYLPEVNFDVFDFNEDALLKIFQQKPNLIKTQLQVTPIDFINAPDWIRRDKILRQIALSKLPGLANLIDESGNVATNLDRWEQAIDDDSKLILNAPSQLDNYYERIADYIAEEDGRDLLMAPATLRKNYDFLCLVIDKNPRVIGYILPTTNRYNELAIRAVSINANVLKSVPEELRDYDVCLAAVAEDGVVLHKVPEDLRDYTMYLTAVTSNGLVLEEVPKNMRDYDMCKNAVTQNGFAITDCMQATENFENLCLIAVSQNGMALNNIFEPEKLSNYDELCLAAVTNTGDIIQDIPTTTKNYRNLCLIAMKKSGKLLYRIPEELHDYDICLAAVKSYGRALQDVPEDIRIKQYDICAEAVKNDVRAIEYVPEELPNSEKIRIMAVQLNGFVLRYIEPHLRTEAVCKAAIDSCIRNGSEPSLIYRDIPKSVRMALNYN